MVLPIKRAPYAAPTDAPGGSIKQIYSMKTIYMDCDWNLPMVSQVEHYFQPCFRAGVKEIKEILLQNRALNWNYSVHMQNF